MELKYSITDLTLQQRESVTLKIDEKVIKYGYNPVSTIRKNKLMP